MLRGRETHLIKEEDGMKQSLQAAQAATPEPYNPHNTIGFSRVETAGRYVCPQIRTQSRR
jgi:hypothetical protein